MKATDELRREHDAIRRMLNILRDAAGRVERGERVPQADLDGIIEFLTVFVDACHHAKEESLLFPALEAAGIPRKGGPVGAMLKDHAAAREFLAEMKRWLDGVKSASPSAARRFGQAGDDYAELLAQHMEKEDNVLFRMAGAILNSSADREMMEGFQKIESERIGEGKHEQFHALLDRLGAKYFQ